MPVIGSGHILMWEGASLWVLEAEQSAAEIGLHAHHALQISFSLAGDLAIGASGQWTAGPIVAVAADVPHRFRGTGAAALLFVEADGAIGRALAAALFRHAPVAAVASRPARLALGALRARFRAGATDEEWSALGRAIVDGLVAVVPPSAIDRRVERMIAFATAELGRRMTLSVAAAQVALSPSRASHLFVEHTGLPFRTYLLWLRLDRAVRLYARGHSLTAAAHEAGFADSAHFSRTFRRTFGVAAASLRLVTTRPAGSPPICHFGPPRYMIG